MKNEQKKKNKSDCEQKIKWKVIAIWYNEMNQNIYQMRNGEKIG